MEMEGLLRAWRGRQTQKNKTKKARQQQQQATKNTVAKRVFNQTAERRSSTTPRTRIIMNTTETKLVSLLYQKYDYHPMVRNEIDLLVKYFINRIETTIGLYATKCKPIIEDKLPIPVLVQQKSDQLLASDDGDDDDETRMVLTPAIYAKEIRNITTNFLKEELEHKYLDSDDRGDTEEEVENLLRLYPEGLELKAKGGVTNLAVSKR